MIGASAVSCRKDTGTVPDDLGLSHPTPLHLPVPAHFPAPAPVADNPLTEEGVELGRQLFYEPMLSANLQVSCASCHHQQLAFSDGITLTAHGVSGKALSRHSPALINLAWTTAGFFWDGGAKNLESQVFGPLTHADEMGMTLSGIAERLRESPHYVELFRLAFDTLPSAEGAAMAIAQFERTLISATSKYDRYLNGTVSLTDQELLGLTLAEQKCFGCHGGVLLTDNAFHNNGIDDDFSDESEEWIHRGRYRVTFAPQDLGAFKTPTLRNVMVSAPYMHDGRFSTIDDVFEHYSSTIKDTPVTDPLLYQRNGRVGISVTEQEKTAMIAFLNTLTDEQFLTDTAFAKPK